MKNDVIKNIFIYFMFIHIWKSCDLISCGINIINNKGLNGSIIKYLDFLLSNHEMKSILKIKNLVIYVCYVMATNPLRGYPVVYVLDGPSINPDFISILRSYPNRHILYNTLLLVSKTLLLKLIKIYKQFPEIASTLFA